MCKSITRKWTSNRFPDKLHKFRNWSSIVLFGAGFFDRTAMARVGKPRTLLDARYETVRETKVIRRRGAVMVATGCEASTER